MQMFESIRYLWLNGSDFSNDMAHAWNSTATRRMKHRYSGAITEKTRSETWRILLSWFRMVGMLVHWFHVCCL